jgi:hypothetical protein
MAVQSLKNKDTILIFDKYVVSAIKISDLMDNHND